MLWSIILLCPVWIALDARPLGNLPYRWGSYVAMEAICAAGVFAFETVGVTARGVLWAGCLYAGLSVIAAASAVGLHLRTRWGVQAFTVMCGSTLILPIMFGAYGISLHSRIMGQGLIVLIFAGASIPYFRNRWKFLR